MGHIVWTARFMKEQGYPIKRKLFYQDNTSAMQIQKNGKLPTGERSRHMNIIYFFIKDIIKREGINTKHCPIEEMLVDYFTKPLKGNPFTKLRDMIMGITSSTMEERVEKAKNILNESFVEECA